MKTLAKKLLEVKRNKAVEMVGKQIEVRVSQKTIAINSEKKTATFVMSTENVDRHGDIVDQDTWMLEHFLKSPMFFLQHKSYEFPIGKWIDIRLEADPEIVGKMRLVGTAEFCTDISEEADKAFKMVEGGYMNAVSVGFIPHRVEYDEHTDAFRLFDCELMECSLVGIGSNRQALLVDKEKAGAIEVKENLEKIIKEEKTEPSENQLRAIRHFKARKNLNQAIRNLTK